MTKFLRITIETIVTQVHAMPDTALVGQFTGDALAEVEATTAEEAAKEKAKLPPSTNMTQRVLYAGVIEVP